MRMDWTDWLLLVTLSMLWGGSFFFGEVALGALPPLTVALFRVGIAAAALVLVAKLAGHRLPRRAGLIGALLVMGLINNVIPFSLILWGQTHIASGLASILNATTPIFTVLLAHALTRDESLTWLRGAGVAAGFAGIVVMMGTDALGGLTGNVAAQVAVLGGALSYGFAVIFGRRFRGEPPLVVAAGQVSASTLMLLPLVALIDQPWTLPAPGASVWSSIAALALLSTALAYIIYFRILARAGASNLSLVTFLIPASAILLGTLVLGETLEAKHVAGMALIGLGLMLIDGRAVARLKLARA